MNKVLWANGDHDDGATAKKTSLGMIIEFLGKSVISDIDARYTLDMIYKAGRLTTKRPIAEEEKKPELKKLYKKDPKIEKNQTILSYFSKKK